MRIAITGRDKEIVDEFKKRARTLLFCNIVTENPDIIVTIGGDGSFLYAERHFPGIPKLIMRHNSYAHLAESGEFEELLGKVVAGEYDIQEHPKLEAHIYKNGKTIVKRAANDIAVQNKLPYRALRFKVSVSRSHIEKELIGDGIVVATSFGSTGYFHSITQKRFSRGFGLAFNNVHTYPREKRVNPIFFEDEKITLHVTRNNAYLAVDNDPHMVILGDKERVEICKSKKTTKIVKVRRS